MALQPAAFRACFANWLHAPRRGGRGDRRGAARLPVDGKTLRRSHDRTRGLGALHSVSVWASEYGLSLGQVACDEKSNEITAIPELLRLVDIQGAIITIDAMGAQRAIAEQIIDGGGDYVLALKGNHETLHEAVVEHFEAARGGSGKRPEHVDGVEKGHGRVPRTGAVQAARRVCRRPGTPRHHRPPAGPVILSA